MSDDSDMPATLQAVCHLFEEKKLRFNLFKCEHIFAGANKNIDVLFLYDRDFEHASQLLEERGYVPYMPEKIEKFKRMYVLFKDGVMTAVHLHRQIAWHGVIFLDKKEVFKRSRRLIPVAEDSLLIHSAHALFENFSVTHFQKELLQKYKEEAQDWDYIYQELKKNGWEEAFEFLLKADFRISKKMVLKAYLGRLRSKPSFIISILKKIIKAGLRKISLRPKGYLVALIGVNGAGKSTLKQAVLEAYAPLTNFVAGQRGYYFGWKKTTRIGLFSLFFPKEVKEKGIFAAVSQEKVKKIDLFQEGLFLFNYFHYLRKYLMQIYPLLRKRKLVVADRYFYDLYGQYPYSSNSILLSWLPFPKPDALFVLDADVEVLLKRDKTGAEKRIVQPMEKLEGQRRRYKGVAKKYKASILDTTGPIQENVKMIIESTWQEYVHGV